jgi:competence protein ComEA
VLERYKHLIFAAVIVAIASGIVALLTYRPAPAVITILPPAPTSTPGPLRVYVSGAVANPQKVYEVEPGSRVQDAITAAGGALPDADLAKINLARVLRDGEQIEVPRLVSSSADSGTQTAGGSAKATETPGGPVHINTATAQELQRLPGVGPAMAQRIIDYRNQHGPFTSMADLDDVPGIGPAKVKEWEGLIVFD